MKNTVSMIAALAMTLGAFAAATPAQAGNFGSGHVNQNWQHGKTMSGRHTGRVCSPREAVFKARHLGMRGADVQRIDNRTIVVAGRHRGNQARIVFARFSPRCDIVRAWGI